MHKLALILFLFASCAFATEAMVTNVVDGDTIHVTIDGQKAKVRILYIDTPEKNGGSKLEKV